MPSSQMQSGPVSQANIIINKAPPPSKPPPPPPPPPPLPKSIRGPPPPPPPPRNSSQIISQGVTLCSGLPVTPGSYGAGLLNNSSSSMSLNSPSRCNTAQPLGLSSNQINLGQRGFMKHGDTCSSRSSVSSHSSLQQHHHMPNNNGIVGYPSACSHQGTNLGCLCSNSNVPYSSYPNSSSKSDNGSCNHGYNQDNRSYIPMPCNGYCLSNNPHHLQHNHIPKCQVQNVSSSMSIRSSINPPTTTVSRNALFYNGENIPPEATMNGCSTEPLIRNHCQAPYPLVHHHHHHNLHNDLSSSSSLSSLQPVDPSSSSSFHRCNMSQSSNTVPSINSMIGDPVQRPVTAGHCGHVHRHTGCIHHHQPNFCDHHIQNHLAPPTSHDCDSCLHSRNSTSQHHDCSTSLLTGKSCINNYHHHFNQDLTANQSSDASNNDSLLSTAHTHNLSNSSTTTHTSNVAVKHQPQYHHRPLLSRGAHSNSSQQYEQYGLSSAASTSSATASLSNYHTPAGFEDLIPYPVSKINQPLPPPPPPILKSRALSTSSTQMSFNNGNNNITNNNNNNNLNMNSNFNMMNNSVHLNVGSNNTHTANNNNVNNNLPHITTKFLNSPNAQQQNHMPALPPLPPKPISPAGLTSSAQITTLRVSPSLQNQPITRVTSQAGVQNPLPNSDVPPPLPPLNPGSRTQPPLVNSIMNRVQQNINDMAPPLNPIPNFVNLNLNRTGTCTTTEAERMTEALTRQVELELDLQQKSGEPLGVCPKCGEKVMMAQEACKAMNQIYHATCFVCCECNRTLMGKTFYPVGGKVYCEEDFKYTGHMQSLEKCAACTKPIFNMILPAMGKSYHPECFKCCVCGQCLDGVPFTIGMKNNIYCVNDYHSTHAPKCATCGKSILPIDGETVRVESMDKNYHIDCYCCEDCGLQLTDEEPTQSYPLDNHLLCQQCHINRLSKMQAALSLS